MKYFYLLFFLAITACSSRRLDNHKYQQKDSTNFTTYSLHVKDSFQISVYLPDTTGNDHPAQFPVVYVLDANLYFDIYATIMKRYSEVGLLPAAIIVGIGYKTFQEMDSLRQRDYTFPEGLPEYEMPVSGRADRFRQFITEELMPLVNRRYPVDTTKTTLVGHSLGGYCVMYSMLEDVRENKPGFAGYIAASPSLHFNHYYLLKQFDSVPRITTSAKKLYVSFGGLENSEIRSNTSMSIDTLFQNIPAMLSKIKGSAVKTAVYSELDHMDTQIPTFTKGLQWILNEK